MPYILLVLTTLFWSGNFVISRGMHGDIPPMALSFWRWAIALVLFSGIGIPQLWRQRRRILKHYRFIAVQGILGVAGFNSLIYLAVQSTTAINAVLVNSCIPVLIGLCSWTMFRELMTLRQCLGVVLSLMGVIWIIVRGDLDNVLHLRINWGDLMVFLAAVIWALYSANLKRYPQEIHPYAYLAGIIMVGLVCILPFYCYEIATGVHIQLSWPTVLTVVYVALFASVLAFIFWNSAVRSVGANRAGPFIHLMPVFSTLLAVFFLDEEIFAFHLVGIVLVFSGIGLATVEMRTGRKNSPAKGNLGK